MTTLQLAMKALEQARELQKRLETLIQILAGDSPLLTELAKTDEERENLFQN
jgi:hypothetical protein